MTKVVDFQVEALARLRAKVADLDDVNSTLLATVRGTRGALAQVHRAVLAALDAEGLDHFIHIVTADWVDILGLDAVVLALDSGPQHVRASRTGIQFLGATDLQDLFSPNQFVVIGAGSPLFGEAQPLIAAHALIKLSAQDQLVTGVLALGTRDVVQFDAGFDTELFRFLGAIVERCINRWLTQPF
jgi:uncharacterized protein